MVYLYNKVRFALVPVSYTHLDVYKRQWLASHWVALVTPVPAAIAKPLVGSLIHEVICQEDDLVALTGPPPHRRTSFDDAVRQALAPRSGADEERPEPGEVPPAQITAADPDWAGGH